MGLEGNPLEISEFLIKTTKKVWNMYRNDKRGSGGKKGDFIPISRGARNKTIFPISRRGLSLIKNVIGFRSNIKLNFHQK